MKSKRTEQGYAVDSELARLCLPAARRDSDKHLAWMNSICFLFLAIGVFGKPASARIEPLPEPDEIIPTMLEPVVPPPPKAVQELTPALDVLPERMEATQLVVVTPDSPQIQFAVPTIGNLVAPVALSAAPPLTSRMPPAAIARSPAGQRVVALGDTGLGGERPQPPYPSLALQRNLEGTVVLLLTVDAAGTISAIDIKEPSSHAVLNRSTVDFVRHRWTLPPGVGARVFQVAITYRLTSG